MDEEERPKPRKWDIVVTATTEESKEPELSASIPPVYLPVEEIVASLQEMEVDLIEGRPAGTVLVVLTLTERFLLHRLRWVRLSDGATLEFAPFDPGATRMKNPHFVPSLFGQWGGAVASLLPEGQTLKSTDDVIALRTALGEILTAWAQRGR